MTASLRTWWDLPGCSRDEGILDEWQMARATGKWSFVALSREIPVRLFYQTVLFDEAGEPVIRADPYGWNDRVATAIEFHASKSRLLSPSAFDVGHEPQRRNGSRATP